MALLVESKHGGHSLLLAAFTGQKVLYILANKVGGQISLVEHNVGNGSAHPFLPPLRSPSPPSALEELVRPAVGSHLDCLVHPGQVVPNFNDCNIYM